MLHQKAEAAVHLPQQGLLLIPTGLHDPGPMLRVELLWMDEILHHFETMGNHCLTVLRGASFFEGIVDTLNMFFKGNKANVSCVLPMVLWLAVVK